MTGSESMGNRKPRRCMRSSRPWRTLAKPGEKRKVPMAEATHSQALRQKAFLTKARVVKFQKGPGSGHRLVKWHRLGAREWCANLDNQIRVSTKTEGLRFYTPVKDIGSDVFIGGWSDAEWRTWPHLAISADCGSDGLAAVHALMFSKNFQSNVSFFPDPAHGCCRSVDEALRVSKLRFFLS